MAASQTGSSRPRASLRGRFNLLRRLARRSRNFPNSAVGRSVSFWQHKQRTIPSGVEPDQKVHSRTHYVLGGERGGGALVSLDDRT